MAATYSIREAKSRFSEVVRTAEKGTPVTITSWGEDAVVVVSAATYKRMSRKFFEDENESK
jgi:prevent-host-death family protein